VPSDGGSIPPTSTNEGFERILKSPGILTQQGFPGFFISGVVRRRALQAMRPWGHILGHLPTTPDQMPPLTDIALRCAKAILKTQKLFDGGGLYIWWSRPRSAAGGG